MNKVKKIIKIVLIISLFIFIGLAILGYFVGKDDKKEPSKKEGIVKTSNESSKVVEKAKSKFILGITPVDVYGNFENKGFKVDKQIDSDGSLFICTDEENGIDYEVKTYCEEGVNDVTFIRLTATRMNPQFNKIADLKPFLKYGCSIPYDGSDAEKISNFIEQKINKDKASITISGVKFTIYAPTQFMRMIDIEIE